MLDRQFRLPRVWSNRELQRIAPFFSGDVVNVSGWEDRDKEGSTYRAYFTGATSYRRTNYPGIWGFQGEADEIQLDLAAELPRELIRRFDVVFNHTTLEHIFDIPKAFANLCEMSRDCVIVVVPFSQIEHRADDWGDYWRFTPYCMRRLFADNGLTVMYEAESPHRRSSIYLLFVGSRRPERYQGRLPAWAPIPRAGLWIGAGVLETLKNSIPGFVRRVLTGRRRRWDSLA